MILGQGSQVLDENALDGAEDYKQAGGSGTSEADPRCRLLGQGFYVLGIRSLRRLGAMSR